MKITDFKTYLVGNPWKQWLFVRVETDEGIHGIGEGTLGHFSKTVEAAIDIQAGFAGSGFSLAGWLSNLFGH